MNAIFKKEVSIGFYGPRSFRVAAHQIWNMLPSHLNNINVSRKQLKSALRLGSCASLLIRGASENFV